MDGFRNYKQDVEKRMEEKRKRDREKGGLFPNIAKAQANYDPKSDSATLQELRARQVADAAAPTDAAPSPAPRGLSSATVEGLMAVKEASERALAQKNAEPAEVPDVDATSSEFDVELIEALRRAKQDTINNEQERKAVEARCAPINFEDGLLSNEFKQLVPILPGRLEITFRTLTGLDHSHVRVELYKAIEKEPHLEQISGDLLGAYQTAAMVVQFNRSPWPEHFRTEGSRRVFVPELFQNRLDMFFNLPLPVIAALGTHSSWFDQRVRQLFSTADLLKNG